MEAKGSRLEGATADMSCGVLAEVTGEAATLQRFVVGVDPRPVPLDQSQIAALDDPFANLLLAEGVFPSSAEQLLDELKAAAPAGDPLASHRTFMVGEGSQLPPGPPEAGVRGFLITCGEGSDGPDVIVSTSAPDAGFVEVMGWDASAQGFNYYQTRGERSPWVLAGNSADALSPGSAGSGPFESHPNGHFLMKELRFPWVHWHSFAARIRADMVSPELARHRWFTEAAGADQLELEAAMPAIERWTAARLEAAVGDDGTVADPGRIIASLLDTPTVNLVSSQVQASVIFAGDAADFDVPHAFFVDTECLNGILGLPAMGADQVRVASADYVSVLGAHGVALRDRSGSAISGPPQDTHFAFVVPERAFEDVSTVRGAIEMGLVSERLAACLLMVDFPNPVFSDRRRALLAHVPPTATVAGGARTFSEELASAIRATAAASQDGTPEQEFSRLWDVGDDWRDRFGRLLTDYYAQVAARLGDRDGLDEAFRLAESRRNRVRAMPIGREHPMLFATPEPKLDADLRMLPTADVEEA